MPTHRGSHHALQQPLENQPRCPQSTRVLHRRRHNTDNRSCETDRTVNADVKQRVLVRIRKSEPQQLVGRLNVVIGIRVVPDVVRGEEAIHQCFILCQDSRGEGIWCGRRAVTISLTPFLNILFSMRDSLSTSSTHPDPKLLSDPQTLRTDDEHAQYEPRPIRPGQPSCKSPLPQVNGKRRLTRLLDTHYRPTT